MNLVKIHWSPTFKEHIFTEGNSNYAIELNGDLVDVYLEGDPRSLNWPYSHCDYGLVCGQASRAGDCALLGPYWNCPGPASTQ